MSSNQPIPVVPIEDRPVVGVVSLDPAYAGPAGIVVRSTLEPPRAALWTRAMPVRSTRLFRELGDALVAICRPGERLAFVAERDAFGPSVARKLGIATGIVEGLLVDLNAVAPESRVDVASHVWRKVLGRGAAERVGAYKTATARRKAWKREAVGWAQRVHGLELGPDAAEALAISEWWVRGQ